MTGRGQPAEGVRIFWIIWVAVCIFFFTLKLIRMLTVCSFLKALGGAYILGLALLPKQYRAESYLNPDVGKPSDDDVKTVPTRQN